MATNPIHNLAALVLLLLFFHLSSANHRTGHHSSRRPSRRPSRHSSGHSKNIPPIVNTDNINGGGPSSTVPVDNILPNPNVNANNDRGPPVTDHANNIFPNVNTNSNGGGPSSTGPVDNILPNPYTNANNNIGPPTTDLASNIPPNVNTNNNGGGPSSTGPIDNILPNPNVNANNNIGPPTTDPAKNIPPNVNTNNNGGGPSLTGPVDNIPPNPNVIKNNHQQLRPPLPITPNSSHNDTSNHKHMAHEFVHYHNVVRATVGEQPFSWDRKLARHARRWSDERRGDCQLKHSGTKEYGENMFWGTGWDWKAADVVKYWASEHLFYDLTSNTCASDKVCGHFTQMVWNTTVKVGCGRAECYNGEMIITCNYFPPGNFVGERPFRLEKMR